VQDETTARDSHSKCPPHTSILLLSPAHSFGKDRTDRAIRAVVCERQDILRPTC